MDKILVIGCCGAGKSTFSRKLSKKANLPLIHLDQAYWNPGWIETPKQEWIEKVSLLASRPKYIMDGNYTGTLPIRLDSADTIIYLDYPTRICFWRVLKRIWQYHGQKRPDMVEGCNERFDLEFLHYVLVFNLVRRKHIYRILEKHKHTVETIILKNDQEVNTYLSHF